MKIKLKRYSSINKWNADDTDKADYHGLVQSVIICPIRVIRVQKNNNIMKTFTRTLATLLTITLLTINISAQTPPPPNGGETPSPGNGNTPVGGGAPIAGGIGILLALGAAYGGKKVYDFYSGK
jgi:hypothetical protein